MRFDLMFSNPPYNGNTDIKILNNLYDSITEYIVVHPATWILDVKGFSSIYNSYRDKINGHLKEIYIFNGNKVFGVQLFVPTTITYVDFRYNGVCKATYFGDTWYEDDVFEITKFTSKWKTIVKPFMNKIKKYDSIWNHNTTSHKANPDKFHVQMASMRGSSDNKRTDRVWKDDFHTIVMRKNELNKGIRNNNDFKGMVWEFDTEIEQENFIEYLKTDFARFCLAIYKQNYDLCVGNMSLIPMLDFTQYWDDDKLFEYFNIDNTTINYIRDYLPDYYNIRGLK